MDLEKIEQQIEQERRILNQMAAEHGIRDHRVIDQSEQLDRILDSYLQCKQRKGKETAHEWNKNC
ncbi:aspartyl-phosphate phosphatase Spo0E family protein [Paenibacillus kandeliae]|uniref:aspartyl-phosphate phosphatase Spo0E family protein n=1 Tax=Paenibacillus kandeliae TaxID=3231269 RepID=UPI00345B18D4